MLAVRYLGIIQAMVALGVAVGQAASTGPASVRGSSREGRRGGHTWPAGTSWQRFLWLRHRMLAKEDQSYLGGHLEFHDSNEILFNELLQEAKHRELDHYFSTDDEGKAFPPSLDFLASKPLISSNFSKVYSMIRSLSKGAVLHAHDLGIIPSDYLVSNVSYRPDLYLCWDKPDPRRTTLGDVVRFGWIAGGPSEAAQTSGCASSNWQGVLEARQQMGSEHVDAKILEAIRLTPEGSVNVTSINGIWAEFEKKFRALSSLVDYEPVFIDSYYEAFKWFMEDGVKYLEMRTTLSPVCAGTLARDGSCSNPMSQLETAGLFREVIQRFTSAFPENFCSGGIKVIYAPPRRVDQAKFETYLELARTLVQKLPDTFIGFDLVGQEDLGRPLIDFAHSLLEEGRQHDLKYFFHAGETLWQGSSTDANLVDALLLGSKRLGHGYAIVKHPQAQKLARRLNVPVEVCPVSNQVLRLVDDLRNHPAAILIQQAFPMVISSDDPALWGADPLSHDFYMAFMALSSRSADLKLIKQLVLNSMQYSGASSECKDYVLQSWHDSISSYLDLNSKL